MANEAINTILNPILKYVLNNPATLLDFIFDIFQRIPIVKSLPGIYEVLDYSARLELQNSKGSVAIYTKTQAVRFLQDNVIAFQDQAWGDGEIFADYQCSPGVEVDRYTQGNRYYILISLRETKHRDDRMTFHIKRTIKNGFTQKTESFQSDIDHRTRNLKLSVVFPKDRLPSTVKLIEQNTKESMLLDSNYLEVLADGRHEYSWQTTKPKLFEAYIMQWTW